MLNTTLAQLNFTVADLRGNTEKIKQAWKERDEQSHLVIFPELCVSGYPPLDLLQRYDFIRECHKAVEGLVEFSKDLGSLAVVGTPYYEDDLYNALLVIGRGRVLGKYYKRYLPNYSVFDEKRYFRKGREPLILEVGGFRVGFSVCEDIWHPDGWERFYAKAGCHAVININASPYYMGKYEYREKFLRARAQDNQMYVVYVNLVGAQDDLVFDGRSLVIDPEGRIIARLKAFEEDVQVLSLFKERVISKRMLDARLREWERVDAPCIIHTDGRALKPSEGRLEKNPEVEEELYSAVRLAIKDYTRKNRFERVVLGLSGGVDSALVACLAVDALGKDKVLGVFMPSMFTSKESEEDVWELAKNLGIKLLSVDIREVYQAYRKAHKAQDFTVADENLQARIRANILFYLSNRDGYLVLSTSNKSESAVGYTTIYGDMSGGYAPIKDLYKTWVYRLAHHRNSIKPDIPQRILTKPPSAELRPNQRDQDTLPPYELLDRVLELYIEENMGLEELLRAGFDEGIVRRVLKMVKMAEYKRRQSPPGPKLTKRALYGDWRMPITSGDWIHT